MKTREFLSTFVLIGILLATPSCGKTRQGPTGNECFFDPGLLMPHPTSCSKYLTCNDGHIEYEMDCPDSLLFNFELQYCDFENNVNCTLTTTPSSTSIETTTTDTTEETEVTTEDATTTEDPFTTTEDTETTTEDTETTTDYDTTTEDPITTANTTPDSTDTEEPTTTDTEVPSTPTEEPSTLEPTTVLTTEVVTTTPTTTTIAPTTTTTSSTTTTTTVPPTTTTTTVTPTTTTVPPTTTTTTVPPTTTTTTVPPTTTTTTVPPTTTTTTITTTSTQTTTTGTTTAPCGVCTAEGNFPDPNSQNFSTYMTCIQNEDGSFRAICGQPCPADTFFTGDRPFCHYKCTKDNLHKCPKAGTESCNKNETVYACYKSDLLADVSECNYLFCYKDNYTNFEWNLCKRSCGYNRTSNYLMGFNKREKICKNAQTNRTCTTAIISPFHPLNPPEVVLTLNFSCGEEFNEFRESNKFGKLDDFADSKNGKSKKREKSNDFKVDIHDLENFKESGSVDSYCSSEERFCHRGFCVAGPWTTQSDPEIAFHFCKKVNDARWETCRGYCPMIDQQMVFDEKSNKCAVPIGN